MGLQGGHGDVSPRVPPPRARRAPHPGVEEVVAGGAAQQVPQGEAVRQELRERAVRWR